MSRVKAIVSRVKLIAILGAGCLTLSGVLAGVPKAAPENNTEPFDPPAVYLTWQHGPTTTMTIQWHSDGLIFDHVSQSASYAFKAQESAHT